MGGNKDKGAVPIPGADADQQSNRTPVEFVDDTIRKLRAKSQKPIAVFLGAGASKLFGYPTTRDLMLEIFTGLSQNKIFKGLAKEQGFAVSPPAKELQDFLVELLPGERMSRRQMPMVTGVLSLLDFSLATGQAILPGWTLDATRRVRKLLERALLEVIPDNVWFDEEEEISFDRFCNLLSDLLEARPRNGLGIITTNYDMVSDVAAMEVSKVAGNDDGWDLKDLARKVDFGFRWVRPDLEEEEACSRPLAAGIRLYKLHGSTNWLRCPLCENVYIHPDGPISQIPGSSASAWDKCCHCSKTSLEAQIVSPSFVREMREPNLVGIWKNALDLLREADHWLIIGYAFPDEDVGIRALFTRAFGASAIKPAVTVVQWDNQARLNYESFFPNDSITYLTGGLEHLLACWPR